MSLQAGLNVALSSLRANATATAVKSSNVAAQVPGAKTVKLRFSSLVTPGSRVVSSISTEVQSDIEREGAVQPSLNKEDLAIVGKGFLPVVRFGDPEGMNVSQEFGFCRDLRLKANAKGYLEVPGSNYLAAGLKIKDGKVNINASGSLTELEAIRINREKISSSPTSELSIRSTLPASDIVGQKRVMDLEIVDSLGSAHKVDLIMEKISSTDTDWKFSFASPPGFNDTFTLAGTANPYEYFVRYNTSGVIQKIAGTIGDLGLAAVAGEKPPQVEIDWDVANLTAKIDKNIVDLDIGKVGSKDGMRSTGESFDRGIINQDGKKTGRYERFSINRDGILSIQYTNSESTDEYQLLLAVFPNINGLEVGNGNLYKQTADSGNYLLKNANSNGTGAIAEGAYESSNVDIAAEFADLIVIQTQYTMTSKNIQTINEMMRALTAVAG